MNSFLSSWIVLVTATLIASVASAEESSHILRDYVVDAAIVSISPDKSIAAAGSHGSGMVANGSTLGLGVRIDEKGFSIELNPYLEGGRLMLAIQVQPESSDLQFEPLDLSLLRPTTISLGKSKDGRLYQANISPRVRITDRTPQLFDPKAMLPHHWSFPECKILLNDSTYVGRLACYSSPVAFLDISDTAKVEFSLLEIAGWKPWGLLYDGTVAIHHPEQATTIEISGVRNGRDSMELAGGPYQVWVNWSESEYTAEEHRTLLLALRDKIAKGEMHVREGALQHLDHQLARDPGPWAISTGVRSYRRDEKVIRKPGAGPKVWP